MGKRKWIILLFVLLAAGAISDGYLKEWRWYTKEPVSVTAPFQPQYTSNSSSQSSVNLIEEITGIEQFRKRYCTSGIGQCIAVIDSGIDLSHAVFQNSDSEKTKVVIYRDYTEEGKMESQPVQAYNGVITAEGTNYQVGSIPNDAREYRIAFLNLQDIMPRVQPVPKQKMAVLITAQNSSRYNCVYLDTNRNCDFCDEIPLYSYAESGQSVTLPEGSCRLNLALTDITSNGQQLHLTADTLGHGTFLAGLMAGESKEYRGLASEASLCVYKIFNRDGQSTQQKLAQALYQAVEDKVSCINLSLSIPKEEALIEELQEALYHAKEADIPVIAAAGNGGPGKNTVSWPARDPSVIAVGSYADEEPYLRDRGIYLSEPFIADYSGRGTRTGSEGPLLVASTGIISAVPGWYAEPYLYDYGTSISAAIVTAAVCHVQQAAESSNMNLSTEQIKNLLAGWASDLGYPAAEQGYGALRLRRMPDSAGQIKTRKNLQMETVIYTIEDSLRWDFSVPQGQSQSWYIEVPKGCKELSVFLQLEQQLPQNHLEHQIAMGRCYLSIYNPDGVLMDQSQYLGASYSDEFCISDKVGAILPQAGIWEIVITSADNLSQYNHLESTGILKVELQ